VTVRPIRQVLPLDLEEQHLTLHLVVRCQDCHRPLHDPESRTRHRGPTCSDHLTVAPSYDIGQDPLFIENASIDRRSTPEADSYENEISQAEPRADLDSHAELRPHPDPLVSGPDRPRPA